ncbi:MAG: hypothetical protein RL072_860 [Actinomycetota bacterium]|jgi:tetratricopeptide (TPR) repeat protein
MPALLSAYLGLLSSEKADAESAGERLQAAQQLRSSANDRELMHFCAAQQLVDGNLYGASETITQINLEFPRDALALFVGHQIDFFTGSSLQLESRVSSVLPFWSAADEYLGYLEGMLAFGLEESGKYDEAMEIGRRAVERHRDDSWGIHAVTHVHEMRGKFEEGIAFLDSLADDWHAGTFLNVHLAWHNALFLLEREDWGSALALYDRFIRHQASANIALEMLDASALLWRLHLEGVDVGNRWSVLADGWAAKQDDPWYVFNDMHAVMAFVAANRRDDALAVTRRLERYVSEPSSTSNWHMTRSVGLPVCNAIVAHGDGDFARVCSALEPVMNSLATFGGSHAQRDVVHRTYINGLQCSGQTSTATSLLESRVAERPTSVWARRRLAKLQNAEGKSSR